ncbi:MAG: hypothetical protein WCA16_10755 [Candidatus Sulfotelmatobacter sp.]
MKAAWKLCVILLLAGTLAAQTSEPSKPRKAKAATLTAADVQALKDAIASQQAALAQQQQQIQELRDELHHRDQAVQQAQSAATDAASKADAAATQASQQQQAVGELKGDVTDLKTSLNNTALTLQETQKSVSESPAALHYKGITITPGGFLAAEFVRRSRALGADINTPFNSLAMPGASQNTLSEFFGSGRQSRISMLAEGRLKSAKLSGYVEADFLSSGTTSNNNESNSYSLRQRQAWGQAALDNGFTFTGGQMWSLVTETKHGMDNRTEALPMTIDPQYTVGFSWARQYGLRVTKNFNNKLWFGFAMENAQATISSHGNASNFVVGSLGNSGGLYNAFNGNYSFNPSPDLVAKVAFEPGFGHYEVFGIYSRFRDRIFPCVENFASASCDSASAASAALATNESRNGGGVGANARWSFDKKRLDFGLHFLGGDGIGRYGTGGLPDAAVHADGTLDPIHSYQGLGTLEWHGPKLDLYANAGAEYDGRAADYDPLALKVVGYGAPSFDNSGCYTEAVPGSGGFAPGGLGTKCTADTRVVRELSLGFWYRLYTGPKGKFQYGVQYSYADRFAWSGKPTLNLSNQPHGLDGMVFTSFRYYLP